MLGMTTVVRIRVECNLAPSKGQVPDVGTNASYAIKRWNQIDSELMTSSGYERFSEKTATSVHHHPWTTVDRT